MRWCLHERACTERRLPLDGNDIAASFWPTLVDRDSIFRGVRGLGLLVLNFLVFLQSLVHGENKIISASLLHRGRHVCRLLRRMMIRPYWLSFSLFRLSLTARSKAPLKSSHIDMVPVRYLDADLFFKIHRTHKIQARHLCMNRCR